MHTPSTGHASSPQSPPRSAPLPKSLHLAEGLTSLAATWLTTGVYFVTSSTLGWDVRANLLLAAAQGLVYIVGSIASSRLTARSSPTTLLVRLHLLMTLATAAMVPAALLLSGRAAEVAFVALLLPWTLLCALNWPALEGITCHADTPDEVSRRVSLYNVVWAVTGALAIASVSPLIALHPVTVFAASAALHLASAWLYRISRVAPPATDAHPEPPPELLAKRVLALRLSRLSLPVSYTVIFSLTPLLAALPAVKALPPAWQSLAVSAWLIARVVIFQVMGRWTAWHTRPGVLLVAAVVMTLAFLAAVSPPPFLAPTGTAPLLFTLAFQLLLGLSLGVIYSGSLYFGMVLAHAGTGKGGSTDQGGQHEALIGVGQVLGPLLGAVSATLALPPAWGVAAIASAGLAACAATTYSARPPAAPHR